LVFYSDYCVIRLNFWNLIKIFNFSYKGIRFSKYIRASGFAKHKRKAKTNYMTSSIAALNRIAVNSIYPLEIIAYKWNIFSKLVVQKHKP